MAAGTRRSPISRANSRHQSGQLALGGHSAPEQPGQPESLHHEPARLPEHHHQPHQQQPRLPGNGRQGFNERIVCYVVGPHPSPLPVGEGTGVVARHHGAKLIARNFDRLRNDRRACRLTPGPGRQRHGRCPERHHQQLDGHDLPQPVAHHRRRSPQAEGDQGGQRHQHDRLPKDGRHRIQPSVGPVLRVGSSWHGDRTCPAIADLLGDRPQRLEVRV